MKKLDIGSPVSSNFFFTSSQSPMPIKRYGHDRKFVSLWMFNETTEPSDHLKDDVNNQKRNLYVSFR